MLDGITLDATGKLLRVRLTGELTTEFYREFVPAIEEQIRTCGKIRILVDMHDFHGWTAGALWEDMKFGLHHFRDIERLAIVGETRWEHGMAVFCKPFTAAKIRYFDRSQADRAEAWIQEDLPAVHQEPMHSSVGH